MSSIFSIANNIGPGENTTEILKISIEFKIRGLIPFDLKSYLELWPGSRPSLVLLRKLRLTGNDKFFKTDIGQVCFKKLSSNLEIYPVG